MVGDNVHVHNLQYVLKQVLNCYNLPLLFILDFLEVFIIGGNIASISDKRL